MALAMQEEREPVITTRRVPAQEALRMMDWDLNHPARGHVMVRIGVIRAKHYAVRYRVGDGHLLYRWGRLPSAELTFLDHKFSHAVFYRE